MSAYAEHKNGMIDQETLEWEYGGTVAGHFITPRPTPSYRIEREPTQNELTLDEEVAIDNELEHIQTNREMNRE